MANLARAISPSKLEEIFNAPASKPPPNTVAHLDHAKNKNKEVLAFVVITLVLAAMSLAARLYSHIFVTKRLHIEDYLGILAFIPFAVTVWAMVDYGNRVGFFVHQWDLRGRVNIAVSEVSYTITMDYSFIMLFLKSAILLDWQRVFALNRISSLYFRISMGLLACNAGLYIAAILTTIFLCNPVAKVWKFWLEGKCIDRQTRDIFNCAVNVVLDIFVFILPQRIIWRLNLNKRNKIGLAIIFSFGILVLISSIGRLYATVHLDYGADNTKSADRTYRFAELTLWAITEQTCMFLVFCIPAIPKMFSENTIFSRMVASVRSWTGLGSGGSSSDSPAVSWPRTIGARSLTRRRYRQADDDLGTTDTIELAMMGQQSNKGILKTLEFNHHDEADSTRSAAVDAEQRQQPWMGA